MTRRLKPVHPSEIRREELSFPLGLRVNRVAMDLRAPVTRIADIVNEKRGITADTASRSEGEQEVNGTCIHLEWQGRRDSNSRPLP